PEQELALAKSFGCVRWYWNFALNACIQHYQETGKSLKLATYKGMLPQLKKEYLWLKEDCYSSVLQCVAINLDRAYKNFFKGQAKFPRFKSKHHKQSIQYPQSVTVKDEYLKVPKIGEVKAVFHREVTGKIKTVTISKSPTDKYFASILCEVEVTDVKQLGDQIIGIDLGLKDFAIVHDGERVTKYANPKHLNRHQKNLALKQKKLSRKTQGSKSRKKFRKNVAKVYERIANSRQDFLHKLSR
ncbi:putative transposase family protein, partial [Lyngbya aestuarii BL J]